MSINELEKLADSYFDDGNLFEAEKLYMRVLANDKQNRNAIYKLAYINVGKLDYDNAEMLLGHGLKIGADLKMLHLLAYVKERQFKLYDAIVLYEQLLELDPSEELFVIIGNLYIQLELYDNAIHISKEYVEKFPTIMAYRRLFLIYLNVGKINELSELKNEIIRKFPNKGLAFNLLGMYEEFIEKNFVQAQKYYEKAVKMGVLTATFDLAQCYKKIKKYDEAERCAKKILKDYPRKNDVLNLLKDINFIERKMRKGYKYYLERDLNKDIKSLKNKWNGKDNKDKTILVVFDSSENENIKNIRYINCLKDKFKNIILCCSPDFVSLMEINGYNVISNSDVFNTKYDNYVLLSELPYYLNSNFEFIPKQELKSEKIDLPSNKFKIGLFWKPNGDSMKVVNISSVNLTKYFEDLFNIDNIEFYSFQKNDIFGTLETYPKIIDISSNLSTMADYAKYINSMDLIITIDSEILHLAGSLNKKVLALISFDAEWYWFDSDETNNVWYPSVELYKQKLGEDWSNVSKKIVKRVEALIKN